MKFIDRGRFLLIFSAPNQGEKNATKENETEPFLGVVFASFVDRGIMFKNINAPALNRNLPPVESLPERRIMGVTLPPVAKTASPPGVALSKSTSVTRVGVASLSGKWSELQCGGINEMENPQIFVSISPGKHKVTVLVFIF